jgi:hypothetical protein
MKRLWLVVITPSLLAPVFAAGQATPQSARVVFEVASIRPNKTPSDAASCRIQPGGRYRATRLTL